MGRGLAGMDAEASLRASNGATRAWHGMIDLPIWGDRRSTGRLLESGRGLHGERCDLGLQNCTGQAGGVRRVPKPAAAGTVGSSPFFELIDG